MLSCCNAWYKGLNSASLPVHHPLGTRIIGHCYIIIMLSGTACLLPWCSDCSEKEGVPSSQNALAPPLNTQRKRVTHTLTHTHTHTHRGWVGALFYCGAFVHCIVACIIRPLFPQVGGPANPFYCSNAPANVLAALDVGLKGVAYNTCSNFPEHWVLIGATIHLLLCTKLGLHFKATAPALLYLSSD